MSERYISVLEFAEMFGVSTTLVYRLIREGEIKAIRIGDRNYRISPGTIDDIKSSELFSELINP